MADIEEFNYIPPQREEVKRRNIETKMVDVFRIFERDGNGTCDVREVGTIARTMGLNPSEAEVAKMVEKIEEPESTGFVRLSKLRLLLMEILTTNEFEGKIVVRDSEDTIYKAFQLLDRDKRGYIESEYLKELMTTLGEKFSSEEVLELVNAAADPETGHIYYEEYAPVLATE